MLSLLKCHNILVVRKKNGSKQSSSSIWWLLYTEYEVDVTCDLGFGLWLDVVVSCGYRKQYHPLQVNMKFDILLDKYVGTL